eukprot:7469047-Pyramimonas_sp.AAC.1
MPPRPCDWKGSGKVFSCSASNSASESPMRSTVALHGRIFCQNSLMAMELESSMTASGGTKRLHLRLTGANL